jgi:hypothetical protein
MNKSWLAGFFDGEGSIGLYQHGNKNGHLNLRISISQCDKDVITKIYNCYPNGYMTERRRTPKNWRPCYHFSLNGLNCEKFLRDIYKDSIVKKQQIKIALEYIDFYKSKIKPGRKFSRLNSIEDRLIVSEFGKKLKELKVVI